MKVDVEIDLYEAHQILEVELGRKLGAEIGAISLTSYGKTKLIFQADGLVEGEQFRHRLKCPP